MEMKNKSDFDMFTERRGRFEDFLVAHRYFVNQIVNQFGSGLKGYEWVYKLYRSILDNPSVEENDMVQILVNGQKWRLKDAPVKGAQFDSALEEEGVPGVAVMEDPDSEDIPASSNSGDDAAPDSAGPTLN